MVENKAADWVEGGRAQSDGPFTAGKCQVVDDTPGSYDGAAVFDRSGQPFCLISDDLAIGGHAGAKARATRIAESLNRTESTTNPMTTAGPKAMAKFPSVWRLRHLFDYCAKGECASSSDGVHWFPTRPCGFCSIGNRIHCGWLVFTGRADAVIWDDGQ